MKIVGQAMFYAVFMVVVVALSVWPRLRILPEDTAVISLSVTHAGQRVSECRRLTQEELDELPPNMRKPEDCPRERHAVQLLLRADDTVLYRQSLPPSGLWSDGKSVAYRRMPISAGRHEIRISMNDSGADGFDYITSRVVTLRPGQNLVIGFDEDDKEFTFL